MKGIINFTFVRLIGLLLLVGCEGPSSVDDPSSTHFVKFYGRDGDQTGVDMVTLPDGSIVLFGTSTPSEQGSTSQWYLVKTDAKGTIIWEKEFGSDNIDEIASDIELTADNRLVAVGNSFTTPTDRDVLIKTFTLDGAEIKSVIKQKAGTDEDAISVAVTSDGFIVVGSTTDVTRKDSYAPADAGTDLKDALHLRFDNNLVEFPSYWLQTTGFKGIDVAVKAIEVSPGLFYFFGHTNASVGSHPRLDYNFWYFAYNNSFNGQGITYYGSVDDEKLGSVAATPSGFMMLGITYTPSGASDIFIQQLINPSFVPDEATTSKPLSIGLGLNVPEKTSVYTSKSGGFFILANEKSSSENQNWVLTKLDGVGAIAWKSPIVFGGEGLDTIGSIKELPDGRLLIIGTMKTGKPDTGESKMTLVKVDAEGRLND